MNMAIEGVRHLIECHCILPQFRNRQTPVYHKFIVFSTVDDDKVNKKLVQCNNCGILHKVVDLCKSEIAHGMEEGASLRTIEDIRLVLRAGADKVALNTATIKIIISIAA